MIVSTYTSKYCSLLSPSPSPSQHWIRLEIQHGILIEQLSIQVEQSDSSYMPNVVVISGGNTIGGLKELKQTTVPSTCRECVLITGLTDVSGWVGGWGYQ